MSLSLAIQGVGVGLSALGAFGASKARKQQAAYNAQVARNNAQIAEDNARDTELRGRVSVFSQRRQLARSLSTIRAATAGSGLVVDEQGTTPQAMVDDMILAGELDALRLRNNIELEKRRAMVQRASFVAKAGQFDLQRSSESPFRSALVAGVGGIARSPDLLAALDG